MTDFLSFMNSKSNEYATFDKDRFPKIYSKYNFIPAKNVIQIVGTNGKGTTGRILAHSILKNGYRVTHYTSPHILDFCERIWINGKNINNIDVYHNQLLSIIGKDSDILSYFEYATMLALYIFSKLDLDFVVLEAGLGGEYDATTVVEKKLLLVTTIDYDHQEFLGHTIEEIATTKLKAKRSEAIIGYQVHNIVYQIADNFGCNIIKTYIEYHKYPKFLNQNLSLAIAGLEFFGIKFDIKWLDDLELFGRFQKIRENIIIDVAHNPLGARAIRDNIGNKKFTFVYNSFRDKNFEEFLNILRPNIDKLLIIDIPNNSRIVQKEILIESLKKLNIPFDDFVSIEEQKEYIVTGSFSVVERFLMIL